MVTPIGRRENRVQDRLREKRDTARTMSPRLSFYSNSSTGSNCRYSFEKSIVGGVDLTPAEIICEIIAIIRQYKTLDADIIAQRFYKKWEFSLEGLYFEAEQDQIDGVLFLLHRITYFSQPCSFDLLTALEDDE